MSRVPAELLREYVNSQKFSSTADVMEAMKDMFRDVLQQVMESELEEQGFQDAISAVYPHAQIQRCIIHQIRSGTRYASYKDITDEGY